MWVIRRTLKHLDGFCIRTLSFIYFVFCVIDCGLLYVTCHALDGTFHNCISLLQNS